MMKKRITITLPDDADDEMEIRSTILDAFSEFVSARAQGDAYAYVEKRYPTINQGGWLTDEEREKKIKEVRRRLQIARRLREDIHVGVIDTEWSDP